MNYLFQDLEFLPHKETKCIRLRLYKRTKSNISTAHILMKDSNKKLKILAAAFSWCLPLINLKSKEEQTLLSDEKDCKQKMPRLWAFCSGLPGKAFGLAVFLHTLHYYQPSPRKWHFFHCSSPISIRLWCSWTNFPWTESTWELLFCEG